PRGRDEGVTYASRWLVDFNLQQSPRHGGSPIGLTRFRPLTPPPVTEIREGGQVHGLQTDEPAHVSGVTATQKQRCSDAKKRRHRARLRPMNLSPFPFSAARVSSEAGATPVNPLRPLLFLSLLATAVAAAPAAARADDDLVSYAL